MDELTIQAAQNGQRSAQAALLRALQDRWYRLCLSLLADAGQAREATQETAYRFLRDLPGFRGSSRLTTWATGIAINVVREMRRQARPAGHALDRESPAPGPPDLAEAAEQRRRLARLLIELPDRQREALVLRYFEGLSLEESAAAMHCAVGTVKATVHQALRALRRKLMVKAPHECRSDR